jgi:hypothetical protein
MTTTAGHSFYIGPIGSFYNQVNDTKTLTNTTMSNPVYLNEDPLLTSLVLFLGIFLIM